MTKKVLSQGLATVLPVVDGSFIIDLHCQTRPSSSQVCSSWNSQVYRCREAFKVHSLVKRHHLMMNKMYSLHITLMVIFTAGFYPITTSTGEDWHLSLATIVTMKLILAIYLTGLLSPFFISQWAKYSTAYQEVRVKREVYSTDNRRHRKLLHRYISSLQDSYPSTPLVFFDFDSSVWSSTIDTGVLIIVTVLTP